MLVFSMRDELVLVRQALDAGACVSLNKSSSPEVLVEAVRKVLAGVSCIVLATELARLRPGDDGGGRVHPRLADMTPRRWRSF